MSVLAARMCLLMVVGAAGAGALHPILADPSREPASFADSVLAVYAIDLAPAREHLAANRYAESETAARAALAAVEEAAGPSSLATALLLDALVAALNAGGKGAAPETLDLGRRALAIKEEALGPEHLETATSLVNLAHTVREQAEYPKSNELLERALAIREHALGPDHVQVGMTLHELAIVSANMGDYPAARRLYERTLAIKERAPQPDSVSIRRTLNSLAHATMMLSDHSAARAQLERALTMGESDPVVAGSTHSILSDLKRATEDYAGARTSCERAGAMLEGALGPEHPRVADNLVRLGLVLKLTGDYAGARRSYERALAIDERAYGPNHPKVALHMHHLAWVALDNGDLVAARELLERALAIEERTLGPVHPRVAEGLGILGRVLVEMQDLAGARPLYERALAIQEQAMGPQNPYVADILGKLGRVLLLQGEVAQAEELFERALAMREQAYGPENKMTGWSLFDLADHRLRAGRPAEARTLYERALGILTRSLGEDYPYRVLALASLARAQANLGEFPLALETALEAEATGRRHIGLIARTLAEREALRDAERWRPGLDLTLALAARGARAGELDPRAGERVCDALIASRGLVFDEMAARRRSLCEASDPGVAALVEEVAAARARLARLQVRGPEDEDPAAYQEGLATARRVKEEAERRLAARSDTFRRDEERSRLGLRELAAHLPERSALVAYARYVENAFDPALAKGESGYLAFVLEAGAREPVILSLGAAGEIEALVAQWEDEAIEGARIPGRSAAEAERAYRRVAAALRERIWDPVASHLTGAERVFVVPDGTLHMVNMAAIPDSEDKYFVETGPLFQVLTTERDLVPGEADETTAKGLLALGGADFDAAAPAGIPAIAAVDSSPAVESEPLLASALPFRGARSRCEEFQRVHFAQLPGSEPEAHEVAELWKAGSGEPEDVKTLVGAAATEAAFKTEAPGHRALHLATHGFFLGGRCEPDAGGSRGIGGLSPAAETAATPKTAPVGENPLLLSGLALAGANRRDEAAPEHEDGILTAEEITAMDLTGVEWVVLSGCETGRGEIGQGEGVFGLQRAFRLAGARTVIMSLWAVKDEAAQQWMRALYGARLANGHDASAAVRAASLQVLRARRAAGSSTHPFFWGAFVAAGDWR